MTQPEQKKKPQPISYAKYSGMAGQMIAIILIGVFGGRKLDQLIETKFPLFTLILTLLSVFFAMYFFIKDVIKK